MPSIKWPNYRITRFFVAAIIILILTAVILYTIMYGFEVKRIEFLGEGMKAEINDHLITGNIIFFPSEKIRQELLRTYPILKDVVIRKKFPHTITIEPILRQPFALLVTQKASYAIDENGTVIGIGANELAVPELHIEVVSVRVGTTLEDQKIRTALLFLKKISPFAPVSVIETNEDGLSFRAVSGQTEILFTQEANIETLMATLQTIMTGVRIKGTMPKIIDVRFTKPVIQW